MGFSFHANPSPLKVDKGMENDRVGGFMYILLAKCPKWYFLACQCNWMCIDVRILKYCIKIT